jgi:hypothetical protein
MAKTAKKTAKAATKTVAKKASVSTTIKPIPLDGKIVVVKAENPFREGTGAYKRTQAVLACKGKTVEDALKKGARRSTVRWLYNHKIVRVAA